MERIYSKVQPGLLLHIVRRLSDIVNQNDFREDIISAKHFIQCSSLLMQKGKTFLPHKHNINNRTYPEKIAQESWVVIRGKVKCIFYDTDDTIIAEPVLYPGDASFTLHGGHNYVALAEGTIVYEYKTGPYESREVDKTFIQ